MPQNFPKAYFSFHVSPLLRVAIKHLFASQVWRKINCFYRTRKKVEGGSTKRGWKKYILHCLLVALLAIFCFTLPYFALPLHLSKKISPCVFFPSSPSSHLQSSIILRVYLLSASWYNEARSVLLLCVTVYLCHGSWIHNVSQNSSVHYLVTTPLSRTSRGVRRYCFMYQTNEDSSLIHFTSTSDTCHRDSIPGADGALSFNITPIGGAGKPSVNTIFLCILTRVQIVISLMKFVRVF